MITPEAVFLTACVLSNAAVVITFIITNNRK